MVKQLLGAVALALALIASGCSGYRAFRQAQMAEQFGDWDQAVLHYLELVDRHPDNLAYRAGLLRAKIKASQDHFERGKKLHLSGALDRAVAEYEQAVRLDPTNQYAQVEYEKLRDEIAAARTGPGLESLDDLKAKTRGARPQPPVLSPKSREPISLTFPKPVSIFDIYRALGKAFGINIQFDPKLRPQDIAIELEDVTAQEALEILMRTATHFYKVLNENTIIVAEDNPQNRRNYEDLVIQTFFLSNAEVKEVMTMLRSLVGAKNIASNDQLNAIILRDSADKVKVAERIILTNDKSRGEVVVDVELLQINTSRLRELGASLSQYTITQSLDPNPIRISDLEFVNQGNWTLTIPSFIYDFIKNSTEAQLLASPQVRISDGEKAVLHIGDRVPIPVTTFNTGQLQGNQIVPITSFQYQEVGIRLDMEPRLHHNKEITLKLNVEVSNLSGSIQGAGGQAQPIIGTRTIQSTIRLKDGETNFLAGLIRNDETRSEAGLPGLSDIPVIGRLFSKRRTERQRTDLVLTLTPHIIRTPDITEDDLLPIWVGTEANITFRGGSPRVESEVEGPFDEDGEDQAERIREMIRRRIQNLPRGLQQTGQEEEPAEPEPGVELVPAGPPSDPFRQPEPEEEDEEGGDDGGSGPLAALTLATGEGLMVASLQEPVVEPAAAGEAYPVRLYFQPERARLAPGETATLRLMVEAGSPVAHLPITLRFDPGALTVRRVEPGGFLGPADRARVLADFSRPGRLVLGASRLGGASGIVGAGVLARIVVTAGEPGAAEIGFEKGKALDSSLRALSPVRLDAAVLEIGAAAAAEPAPPPERPERTRPRDELESVP